MLFTKKNYLYDDYDGKSDDNNDYNDSKGDDD